MQPADTLLSQINKGHGPSGSMVNRLITLVKEAGFRGLFAGLGPRMSKSISLPRSRCLSGFQARLARADIAVMTAGLVSSQFLMYGEIKKALGARPGIEIHKDE